MKQQVHFSNVDHIYTEKLGNWDGKQLHFHPFSIGKVKGPNKNVLYGKIGQPFFWQLEAIQLVIEWRGLDLQYI